MTLRLKPPDERTDNEVVVAINTHFNDEHAVIDVREHLVIDCDAVVLVYGYDKTALHGCAAVIG